jgi:hypothetical protein
MPLERVEASYERIELEPLSLHREDLVRASDILAQHGPVEVKVNDKFKFTEPSGWEEVARTTREPVTSVKIEARNERAYPSIELSLSTKYGSYIHIHGTNNELRGLAATLKSELGAHKRRNIPFWMRVAISQLFNLTVAATVATWMIIAGTDGRAALLTALPAGLVSMGLTSWIPLVYQETKTKIVNATYAEDPPFRERLFEDHGVALFWTIFGCILGGLIGYFVNQLPPLP